MSPAVIAAIRTPEIVWSAVAPQLILMAGGLLLLTLVSVLKGRLPRHAYVAYTVAVAAASFIATIPLWGRVGNPREGIATVMGGAVGLDRFGLFVIGVLCIGLALSALIADGYLLREDLDGPELYVLMMLSASGGATMATANDLIVLFVGFEILSVSVYVLAAMHARRLSSQEAGFKYFVLGAFSSAFLLYGIALTYGATGSTNLVAIQAFLADNVLTQTGLLLGGMVLMLVGFGFKVAAVPFHMWAPDVYQGAPSPVSGFMASVVKAAAFAGLLRIFAVALSAYQVQWRPVVFVLAVLSLVVGAVLAVVQRNIKRILAYSSINHAGFILLGVHAATQRGTSASLFYLLAYTFMVIGSFGVVTVVGRTGDGAHSLDDYSGLSRRRPGLAFAFTILLLAQAGVPFTAGFLAKFYVLAAAAETGSYILAVVAMLSAVVSAFIYLRIVVAMYFEGAPDDSGDAGVAGDAATLPAGAAVVTRQPWPTSLALTLAVACTLLLGILPGPFAHLADTAVAGFRALGR